MNAETAASFLSVTEEWGIGELVGILGKGFASELQLGSRSESGLKELEVKVREGLGGSGEPLRTLQVSEEARMRGGSSFSFPLTY